MASPCWTCRTHITAVMRVYGMAPTHACPLCMDDEDPQVCVAVPCGHHICGSCARHWADRQAIHIPVPGTNAAAPRPVPYAAEPMLPPPWAAAAPPPAVEPTMPPPRAPTLGEAFRFTGRLVLWTRLYRFDPKIVLVWADSGLLCQGGDHVVRPAGMAGYVVEYHRAAERANRKWFLEPQVYDV